MTDPTALGALLRPTSWVRHPYLALGALVRVQWKVLPYGRQQPQLSTSAAARAKGRPPSGVYRPDVEHHRPPNTTHQPPSSTGYDLETGGAVAQRSTRAVSNIARTPVRFRSAPPAPKSPARPNPGSTGHRNDPPGEYRSPTAPLPVRMGP